MTTIPKSEIHELVTGAFKKAGLTDESAINEIYTHLMYNELCGKRSHGLLRVKWSIDYIKKHGPPIKSPDIALDNGALTIIDGQNNLGLVTARYAADIAISKAKTHGIAFVGARNHFGTTGTMHYYNRLFVDNGLVGIAGCNSFAMVCHPDGFDPVLGTNPISFGIPSSKTPCIIDVTTAQWAYGKLLEFSKAGKDIPVDAFVDKDGKPSTNIKDAKDGAMLPMNGYKGFAIGLAIEVLSGALIGAKSGLKAVQGSDGIFFITINPDMLVGQAIFEEQVEALLQEIKSSRHNAEITELLIPGERSESTYQSNQGKEHIDVVDTVYNELKDLVS
mgnify:CR=1 FL=1|tara:strand:+ start:49895 stop:50893 length:999 start_codon:yes stop_codon:yes gene_type:complete